MVDEFELEVPRSGPGNLALGPDSAIWLNGTFADSVGRLDPQTREVVWFPLPTKDAFADEIALGSDGNLWVTERFANKIARVTLDGGITELAIPTAAEPSELNPRGSSGPVAITSGPGGTMWLTEIFAGRIGRLDLF